MNNNESISEEALIQRMQQGDQNAMKITYDKYVGCLTAVCSRYIVNSEDVRDVLQDSFVKIFSNIDKYEYVENASLKSWMIRIVVNDSLKFLKKTNRLKFIESIEEYPDTPDEKLETDGISYPVLKVMISQLPAGYRTVFNLFVFEEKSHKEIAAILGIKENTSASQFFKAKKILIAKITELKKHL